MRLSTGASARGEPIVASRGLASGGSRQFRQPAPVEPYTEGELDGLAQTFWPDHCVQHSEGAALHPLLKQQAIAAVFHKGQNRSIDSYSAFFDNGHRQKTELDGWLRGQGIVELTVLGLATDYCVKFTVLDALGAGLRGQRHHRRLSRRKSAAAGQQPRRLWRWRRGRHALYPRRLAGNPRVTCADRHSSCRRFSQASVEISSNEILRVSMPKQNRISAQSTSITPSTIKTVIAPERVNRTATP